MSNQVSTAQAEFTVRLISSIASVCHEANRQYCVTIGDNSQLAWNDAPDWQKESAMKGVQFHLEALAQGREQSPSASHDAWLAEKSANGWTYGPVKDAEKKQHPCFVPYDKLPAAQRAKDYIFAAIVKARFEALGGADAA